MNVWVKGAVVALLAIPGSAMAQDAAKLSCYEIRYSLDFLSAYPNAPAMCEEVKEVEGVKYARLSATVVEKKKGSVVVGFKDVFGNKLTTLEIEAVEGSKVSVNGEDVSWKEVDKDTKLSFWLPERSMHVVAQPGRGVPGAPLIFRSRGE